MIKIVGFEEYPDYNNLPPHIINVTSRSKTWAKGLSPFLLGPVNLWDGAPAKQSLTVENAWQFSHVYLDQITLTGDPSPVWYKWSKEGFESSIPQRNPKGKNKKDRLYAFWDNKRLNPLEARLKIYLPLYTYCVVRSKEFETLFLLYKEKKELTLWDFDGYNHRAKGLDWKGVIYDTSRSLGHAFILGYLLERGVNL